MGVFAERDIDDRERREGDAVRERLAAKSEADALAEKVDKEIGAGGFRPIAPKGDFFMAKGVTSKKREHDDREACAGKGTACGSEGPRSCSPGAHGDAAPWSMRTRRSGTSGCT